MKSKSIESIDIDKVAKSLKEVIQTLSFVSYKATEDSGDYKNKGNGGRSGVYKLYWQNEYQFIFFSVFYSLNEESRNEPLIKKIGKDSFKIYKQYLSDGEACKKAYLERKGPSQRIKGIRVMNGKKASKPKAMTLNELIPIMKKEAFLIGWEKGIPPHLANRANSPVFKS